MIPNRAGLWLVAALTLCNSSAGGQLAAETTGNATAQHLSLSTAVDLALGSYPTVGQAQANYEAAEAVRRARRAAYFPTLQLSGTLSRYENPMVVTPIHGFAPGQIPSFDRTLIQGSVKVGFLVFDGFKRRWQYRQISAEVRAADVARTSTEQALLAQTVTAYLAVESTREIESAHRRKVEAFEAERARVEQLRKVGKAADVEALRIEAALAAARADLVDLEEKADLAVRDLARLTGLSPDEISVAALEPLQLSDSTTKTRDALMAEARATSPQLKVARWQTAAAAFARGAARGERWPRLQAAANYLSFDSPDVKSDYEWNAGLELTFPIFTGGAISSAVARATAAEHAAAEEERRVELEVGRAVDMASSASRKAKSRAASLARAVDRYAEVARIEKLLLESGAGTQTDFLDAQADLLTAQAGLVEARQQIMATAVELARVTGTLSRAWLTEKLEQTQ